MSVRFFVWTICRGCGWLWYCMIPIGRHHTSGLSFMLSAIRSFLSAAAQGCNGSAKPRPATSLNDDVGIAFGSGGGAGWAGGAAPPGPAPAPRPRPPPPPPPVCQMPDKSTLPSAVRGAGPARSGFPSFRGTSGVGYDGHWAANDAENASATAAATAVREYTVMRPPEIGRRNRSQGLYDGAPVAVMGELR